MRKPYGADATATHFIDSNTWATTQLGSAMGFSARLIAQKLKSLPNFNIDGDRGWLEDVASGRSAEHRPDNLVPVHYIDP